MNIFEDQFEQFQALSAETVPGKVAENIGIEQRTRAWFRSRIGNITSSRVPDIMGTGRGVPFGAKAIIYLKEKVIERTLTPEGVELYIDQQMSKEFRECKWGTKYEPEARQKASEFSGIEFKETTFKNNLKLVNFGGSADFEGYLSQEVIDKYQLDLDPQIIPGEIKCPYNILIHQANLDLLEAEITEEHTYYGQIQSHILNADSKAAFFVSYDPRRAAPNNLAVFIVPRDQVYIDRLNLRLVQCENAISKCIFEGIPVQKTLNNK